MSPTLERALANLERAISPLTVVFIALISVLSFGEDLRVVQMDGTYSQNSRRALLWHNAHQSGGSQGSVSITLTPATANVTPGGKLQFTATLTNTNQTAVSWSASAGSISSTGLFTAPAQSGTVTVTASSVTGTAQVSASVSVMQTLQIVTSALSSAQVGTSYSATLSAQGGSKPYSWSLASGSLPSGLNMTSAGLISGTPSQSGTFSFAARVSDSSSQTSVQQFSMVATPGTNPAPVPVPSGSSNFDGPAELPRVFMQSAMSDTPAPGRTILVSAGASLETALNNASCGDTIELQAGATFSGLFTLPAKDCDDQHWIVIRSSAPDSVLPPEGTRMTPCFAGVASLPGRPALNCASTQKVTATLVAIKAGGPITFASGANHYRIGPGLEITRPAGIGINYGLIIKDADIPVDHIVVDRDWLHGSPRDETTRGVYLSGITYAAVVDSYLNDFHCNTAIGACVDSQAISGGLGNLPQGTWKITNNFLEAAAENILFGGGVGTTVPTDIEIRHNHLFKPMTWMPGHAGFVGGVNTDPRKCTQFGTPGYCPFTVKNLFELKNAQRVLFEGNILEYTWPGFTQHGAAILLTALSQGGTTGNPNATVADVTIRYNHVSHATSGIVMAKPDYGWGPPKLEARLSIHDDIFDDLSPTYANGDTGIAAALAFQITQCSACTPIHDVSISHVTMLMASSKVTMILGATSGTRIQNMTFTNNIVSSLSGLAVTSPGATGPCAFSGSTNLARLNNCLLSYRFAGNSFIGANGTWPTGNKFPINGYDVGFLNYNNGDGGNYQLMSTSPYYGATTTDGLNAGADVNAVDQAIAGVF